MTILLSALKFYTTIVKIAKSAYKKKYLTSNGLDFDAYRYLCSTYCFALNVAILLIKASKFLTERN